MGDVYSAPHCGGVAEWLKATVLKTVDGKPSESSNLSSSAIHSRRVTQQEIPGGMAEWLKATVLKTVDGKPSQSSNLCSSAILKKPAEMRAFCFSAFTDSEKHRVAFQSAAVQQRRARLLLYSNHGFCKHLAIFRCKLSYTVR
jgi:hypothetical protein